MPRQIETKNRPWAFDDPEWQAAKAARRNIDHNDAVQALYPQLEARPFHGVMGFFIPGERQSVIDVIYPDSADFAETLAHPIWTEDKTLGLRYRIPSLETILANKYGAMLNLARGVEKRLLDVADFYLMVKHSMDEGRHPIDPRKLEDLGELVWPGGGGPEILRLVEQVRVGKPINLDGIGRLT